MKDVINLTLVFVLAWLGFQFMPSGVALQGLDVFNTTPFDCPERSQIEWINTLGDIRIYNAKVWYGAYQGIIADIGTVIYRVPDDTILFHENWDHYAEPTGLHNSIMNWTPNYIELKKGDRLNMIYWCTLLRGESAKAHLILTIWYK